MNKPNTQVASVTPDNSWPDPTKPKPTDGTITGEPQQADLNTKLRDLCDKDRLFFEQAFTDPTTGKPYDIPENLKRLATRLCRSYGINGTCDPMYIANIIAFELGIGDGKSNFTPLWKNESQSL